MAFRGGQYEQDQGSAAGLAGGGRVAGPGVPHDRRALRYGPQDGAALRGGPRRHPVCPATTMSALSMTG